MSINVTISVHIHETNFVCSLIIVNDVCDELALAVILKPSNFSADVGTGYSVNIAIVINVAYLKAM